MHELAGGVGEHPNAINLRQQHAWPVQGVSALKVKGHKGGLAVCMYVCVAELVLHLVVTKGEEERRKRRGGERERERRGEEGRGRGGERERRREGRGGEEGRREKRERRRGGEEREEGEEGEEGLVDQDTCTSAWLCP